MNKTDPMEDFKLKSDYLETFSDKKPKTLMLVWTSTSKGVANTG